MGSGGRRLISPQRRGSDLGYVCVWWQAVVLDFHEPPGAHRPTPTHTHTHTHTHPDYYVDSRQWGVNDHITTAGDENSLLKGTETILVATARLIKDRNKAGISAFKLAQQSTPAPGPCGPVELLCKRLRSVRRHWLITPGN